MRYIVNYFSSFIIILSTIATINWFIDPFGMYWSPKIFNLNQLKPEAGTRTRISKAYQVKNINPEVLLVGNSRVEMGLSPKSDLFQNKVVYNQAMPGAHIVMQTDFAIDAIKTTPNIKHLLIGVDFLDFLLTKNQLNHKSSALDKIIKESYSFRLESRDTEVKYSSILRFKEKVGLIFSLDALSASLSTLAKQNTLSSSIDEYGFNSALSYLSIMKSEGIKPLFKQKLQEISIRLKTPLYIVSPQKPLYSPRFKHLTSLIDEAKKNDIKVTLFINPYHFSYLHTLAEQNQWQNFLTWKKSLTVAVHKFNSKNIILWDFSGFNNFINEAVSLTTPKIPMLWFWEPAHYRKELGEKMLTVMLVKNKSSNINFGRQLSLQNIDSYITEDKIEFKKSLKHWQQLKENL